MLVRLPKPGRPRIRRHVWLPASGHKILTSPPRKYKKSCFPSSACFEILARSPDRPLRIRYILRRPYFNPSTTATHPCLLFSTHLHPTSLYVRSTSLIRWTEQSVSKKRASFSRCVCANLSFQDLEESVAVCAGRSSYPERRIILDWANTHHDDLLSTSLDVLRVDR